MGMTEDCNIQNRMLQAFWERQKEMVLTQLGMWMLTLPQGSSKARAT